MALLDTETQVSVLIGGFTGGLDHPECISWGCDGFAYAGGELGQVYRISVEQKEFEEFANTGGFVGGIAQDGKHRLYVCSGGVKRVEPDGTVSVYCDGTDEQSIEGANYPVFDRHGNLYVSHSGGWKEDNGCIFRITPGGKGEVWCRSLAQFPNGVALDAAGAYLYVVMSLNLPRVDRVEIKADGGAGEVETLVHLPETVPDGLAFDTEGNLYISCYRPDRIYRLTPDGQLDVLAEDYEGTAIAAPTNIAFCGQNRDLFLNVVMSLNPPRVDRVEIKADGGAGDVETLVHLPETVPDGLAFDTEGNLYISCYRPDRIYRLTPDGQLDVLAEDYEGTAIAAPTNIAFCGQNRDLFLSANLGRWHITHYDLGKTGMPLNYPDI